MRFPRQEYQSGLPFPAPRDLPNLGIKPASPALREVKWKSLTHVWLFATPWTIQSKDFSRPDTGVGSLSLLQGIFPTQGSNLGLPHCTQILYQLSHKGSLRILKWVAYPFSSRSSQPRNPTGVSCLAGRFFTNWAMREAIKPHLSFLEQVLKAYYKLGIMVGQLKTNSIFCKISLWFSTVISIFKLLNH